MQHENDKLAANRIKWLGLWASEMERCYVLWNLSLGLTDVPMSPSFGVEKDGLLPITKHDEKKV